MKKKKQTITVNLSEQTLNDAKEHLLREGITISSFVEMALCLSFIKPTLFKQLVDLLHDDIIDDSEHGSYKNNVKEIQIKTTAKKLYKLLSKSFPMKRNEGTLATNSQELKNEKSNESET